MARYREPDPDQSRMVVLNFTELFPADHLVPRLLRTVQELDLSAFDQGYSNDDGKGGRPALPPDRVLTLIIYSLLYGNVSMRNLERDLHQRADLMYLSGGLTIDHSTLGKFRVRHSDAIRELFTQTVFLGIETGLIDLDTVCIDGTRIRASANRQDIGDRDALNKRYAHTQDACRKRYVEWEESDDTGGKRLLAQRLERLNRQKARLKAGLKFLKERPDKKRVHLTDADADWQRDGHNKFIVGYNAQNAVDASSRMIVHQEIVTNQSDMNSTVPMVNAVEAIKQKAQSDRTDEVKYVLDSGYASEKNLNTLKDRDLYMPDQAYARQTSGGKLKPENRKQGTRKKFNIESGAEPVFRYQSQSDTFVCPAGKDLKFSRERELSGISYRQYRKSGCAGCPIQKKCSGLNRNRKEVWIRSSADRTHDSIRKVPCRKRRAPPGKPATLTTLMRLKLETPEGRAIYSRRFPISEGVYGTLKAVRNGGHFLRRGLARVQIEWAERAIAHNIARLIGFTRVSQA